MHIQIMGNRCSFQMNVDNTNEEPQECLICYDMIELEGVTCFRCNIQLHLPCMKAFLASKGINYCKSPQVGTLYCSKI
jgi:hypothetical protein